MYMYPFWMLLLKMTTLEIKSPEEESHKYLSCFYGILQSEVRCFNSKMLKGIIPLVKHGLRIRRRMRIDLIHLPESRNFKGELTQPSDMKQHDSDIILEY